MMFRKYGEHVRITLGKNTVEMRDDKHFCWRTIKQCKSEYDAHVEALLLQCTLLAEYNLS